MITGFDKQKTFTSRVAYVLEITAAQALSTIGRTSSIGGSLMTGLNYAKRRITTPGPSCTIRAAVTPGYNNRGRDAAERDLGENAM